jgi:hypothetical protein
MNLQSRKCTSVSALLFAGFLSALCTNDVNATETILFSNGFENNNGGFTHTGTFDTWEWGIPSANFTSGPQCAHSGSKCWGTDLDDTVPFNSNAYLTSPAITLPAIGADLVLRARFYGWTALDLMSDRGEFQVSSDGINWVTKAELLCVMQSGWNEYVFDISAYAGGVIYLRFRCVTDGENTFSPPEVPQNMAGFYIDDIAITLSQAPTTKKIFTFEGSESQNTIASCPWILIPRKKGQTDNGKGTSQNLTNNQNVNSGYVEENDIYSTARGNAKEYTDFCQLINNLPVEDDSTCVLKLKETGQEESFTDILHLIAVDHSPSVDIASDDSGKVFTFEKSKTIQPLTAVDKNGADVLKMVKSPEEYGYRAFNGDYTELSFNWTGSVPHPILLLKAQGFVADGRPGTHMPVWPKIEIQTQNSSGQWITRHIFYPRWKPAQCGYDLAGLLPYAKKVRLISLSCHTGKYNLIDWVALSTEPQKSVTVTNLAPVAALRSDGISVVGDLQAADSKYTHLIANEEIILTFKLKSKVKDNKLDFIVKSRGFYNPTGTYFFYTWNGSAWALRDGWTIPLDGDQTRQFDFSLWLPDPTGQNRVRIWQDFIFDEAAIDYTGLKRDSAELIMSYATDLRNNNSILNLLNVSDNQRQFWDYGEDWPNRIRWVEIGWSDTFVNTPPSTNPVYVTNTGSSTPTINWTYFDLDGNPQKRYEVEVWTGSGGTGNNIWDPQSGQGNASAVVYAGASLMPGVEYYARVKAYDSLNWGGWSETPFIVSINNPPIAEAGNDTVIIALPSCLTSVALNGSASHDPDGDTLTYLWTGPFGTATGVMVAVSLFPDTARIILIVSDGKGGSGMDSMTIIVRDTVPPVPDSQLLSPITGECSVTISNPPTATDNCLGKIVGTTDSLVFGTPGMRLITWCFRDNCGNVVSQNQLVTITENIAPVPDLQTLPPLIGYCFVEVTQFPTATDNCAGTIVGSTLDSLSYSQIGTDTIVWHYEDGSGNISTQIQQVVVIDNNAPVPNVPQLPVLQNSCVLTVSSIPTATDNCKGVISGTTSDPLVYQKAGTYLIHWHYNDGNGNSSSQTQTAIVIDNTAPVPNANPLPPINGVISGNRCYTVRTYPTATDNCKDRVVGTTTSLLTYCYRGTFSIVWQYSDGNGNITTQNQTVNIQ